MFQRQHLPCSFQSIQSSTYIQSNAELGREDAGNRDGTDDAPLGESGSHVEFCSLRCMFQVFSQILLYLV